MKRKHRFDLGGRSSYFLEKVNLVLKPAGFTSRKKDNAILFHRGTPFGYNQLYLTTAVEDRVLRITPFFYVRVNSVNMLANPFLGCPEKLYGCNPTIGASLRNLGFDEDHFVAKTAGDVEALLFIFEDMVESRMLPFFSAFYSAARLDEELNRDERPPNLFLNEIIERPVVGTVAAWLNRNKQFSARVDYYRHKLLLTTPKIEANYESLLECLKIHCH
jgi:hypothetical protein